MFPLYLELTSEQCVVLLGLTFAIMFVRVGVEALITPLSYLLLRWGDLENSVYYSVTGVLVSEFITSICFVRRSEDSFIII